MKKKEMYRLARKIEMAVLEEFNEKIGMRGITGITGVGYNQWIICLLRSAASMLERIENKELCKDC